MYNIGSQFLGTYIQDGNGGIAFPDFQFPWKVEIYHRTGGLIGGWYLGQNDCPINSIEFENNMNGCGAGKLSIQKLTIPIDYGNYIKIYRKGIEKYFGIFDTNCDPKGGEIFFFSPKKLIEKNLWPITSYVSKTMDYILEDIITALVTEPTILWNSLSVDTDDTTLYSFDTNYDEVKKKLDDLISGLDAKYWGVNAQSIFFVKSLDSTNSKTLYQNYNPGYGKIKIEYDYDSVEYTRLRLFRKPLAGGSESEFVDSVGYVTPIDLEKIIGIKEALYTFDTYLDSTTCLLIGQALIDAQYIKRSISVDNIDLSVIDPEVGQLITVQDTEEKQLLIIIPCDTVTGWTGATLSTTEAVEGTACVYASFNGGSEDVNYVFSGNQSYKGLEYIGFMMKADYAGNYISVKIENAAAVSTTTNISIPHSGSWFYYKIPYTGLIKKISFLGVSAPLSASVVRIDRIQVYAYSMEFYTANIMQINYIISPAGENINMKLESYNQFADKELYKLKQKYLVQENLTKG